MSAAESRGRAPAFRWGILGTGEAARSFVLGLRHADNAAAVVVASRSVAHAREFATRFAVPAVAADYRQAVTDHEVDAFYLATPPTTHRPLALACLDAGRPVLVEKPFAADRQDAAEIVRAARSRSVFCMEALWTRFLPLLRRAEQLVTGGALGEIRVVTGSFGRPTDSGSRPALFAPGSGGALLHRGIYPMSLATRLLGLPELVSGTASLRDGVDVESVVVARHERGGISVSVASLVAPGSNDLVVQGTRGTLHVRGPVYRPYRMTLTRDGTGGGSAALGRLGDRTWPHALQQRLGGLRARTTGRQRTVRAYYRGNGYCYEADEVARCVRTGRVESPVMPLDESLAIAAVLTEARLQWSR